MRKKKEEQPEGVEEWIVTYGDVMALLLTFFVLLFSFSTIDAQKWEELVRSFGSQPSVINMPMEKNSAIENLVDQKMGVNSSIIETSEVLIPKTEEDTDMQDINTDEETTDDQSELERDKEFEELYDSLSELASRSSSNMDFEIIKTENEIRLRFSNNLLFGSGSTTLDEEATNVIYEIAQVALEYEPIINQIIIEGNTDDIPITGNRFKDNFDLSLQRALVVLFYMKDDAGFPPQKLVAMGYGEYNPVADNDTEDNRALNRRTDLVLTRLIETD